MAILFGGYFIWWLFYLVAILIGGYFNWWLFYLVAILFGGYFIWWLFYLVAILIGGYFIWWLWSLTTNAKSKSLSASIVDCACIDSAFYLIFPIIIVFLLVLVNPNFCVSIKPFFSISDLAYSLLD